MRRAVALGLLVAAACGGDDEVVWTIDASDPDAALGIDANLACPTPFTTTCNPGAQTGCQAGEKCTWVRLTATAEEQTGRLGCVPAGAAVLDGSCTWGASGVTTGYDDCAKGLVCAAPLSIEAATGVCQQICDVTAVSGAPGACLADFACGELAGYFTNCEEQAAFAGVCNATCNPLTQTRDHDGAACACYGFPSDDHHATAFACDTPGSGVHRDAVAGAASVNACAPGYIPYLQESATSTVTICVSFCQPRETFRDQGGASCTTDLDCQEDWFCSAAVDGGDGTCHPSKGASPYRCSSPPRQGTFGAGEECRYLWRFEAGETPLSRWSNDLGLCLDYTKYTWDHDDDANTAEVPVPSCTTLSNTDQDGDGRAEHLEWGCGPYPEP